MRPTSCVVILVAVAGLSRAQSVSAVDLAQAQYRAYLATVPECRAEFRVTRVRTGENAPPGEARLIWLRSAAGERIEIVPLSQGWGAPHHWVSDDGAALTTCFVKTRQAIIRPSQGSLPTIPQPNDWLLPARYIRAESTVATSAIKSGEKVNLRYTDAVNGTNVDVDQDAQGGFITRWSLENGSESCQVKYDITEGVAFPSRAEWHASDDGVNTSWILTRTAVSFDSIDPAVFSPRFDQKTLVSDHRRLDEKGNPEIYTVEPNGQTSRVIKLSEVRPISALVRISTIATIGVTVAVLMTVGQFISSRSRRRAAR